MLLVDDDAAVRDSTRMLLEVEGYRVQAVASLAAALAAVDAAGPIDILVADHTLGNGEDGARVIAALRERQGDALKAVLLGEDTPLGAYQPRLARDPRICRRPSRTEDLLRAIHELLGEGDAVAAMPHVNEETAALFVHDLRSSLAVISNVLKTCRAEALSVSLPNAGRILDRQITKSLRMAEDLLTVLQLGSVSPVLASEPVSLTRIIIEAAKDLEVDMRQREQSLTLDLPPDELWTTGDSMRLGQVIANVLENASKYSGRGGRVCISAYRSGQEVEVRIRDNGIGIRPEDLPHIYDPYFRSRSSRRCAPAGSGLGLPLARRLIELHNGTIQARSDGPGLGAEFTVRVAALAEPTTHIG